MSIKIKSNEKTKHLLEIGDAPVLDSSFSSIKFATVTSPSGSRYINIIFKPDGVEVWWMLQIVSDGKLKLHKSTNGSDWIEVKSW